MTYSIKSREAYIETAGGVELLANAVVAVEGSLISSISAISSTAAATFPGDSSVSIDLSKYILLPGLIDMHVHGGGGVDVMDGTEDAVEQLCLFKLNEGVTSFCPTTVTASPERFMKAIEAVKTAKQTQKRGAKIIGTFVEGPYIDPTCKGAHPENFIREISVNELDELVAAGEGSINSVAIAPSLPGAVEAIKFLKSKGAAVRIGHSAATLEQTNAAIVAGADVIIHTYNAMSALTHREPGMVGAALLNENVYAEIICDLVHVHPEAMRLLVKTRGAGKIALITDCMMAGGCADGNYILGELGVSVKNGEARLPSGMLAGSTLNLMTAIKNMRETVGVPFADAVRMASLTPAAALGRSDVGGIKTGKKADLIAIDESYKVVFVMVDGVIVLDKR